MSQGVAPSESARWRQRRQRRVRRMDRRRCRRSWRCCRCDHHFLASLRFQRLEAPGVHHFDAKVVPVNKSSDCQTPDWKEALLGKRFLKLKEFKLENLFATFSVRTYFHVFAWQMPRFGFYYHFMLWPGFEPTSEELHQYGTFLREALPTDIQYFYQLT